MKKFALAAVAVLALSAAACGQKVLSVRESKAAALAALQFTNAMRGQFIDCANNDPKSTGTVICTARLPTPTPLGGHRLELAEIACSYGSTPGCALAARR